MSNQNKSKKTIQPSEMTLQEIAETMNVTRERVRQIEAKAIRKLRQKMNRTGRGLIEIFL